MRKGKWEGRWVAQVARPRATCVPQAEEVSLPEELSSGSLKISDRTLSELRHCQSPLVALPPRQKFEFQPGLLCEFV